jgi:hypothetical protein
MRLTPSKPSDLKVVVDDQLGEDDGAQLVAMPPLLRRRV